MSRRYDRKRDDGPVAYVEREYLSDHRETSCGDGVGSDAGDKVGRGLSDNRIEKRKGASRVAQSVG